MSLYAAWSACSSQLKPQVQGDCGVYSFWYATVLLRHLDPTNHAVTYPRANHEASLKGKSIRAVAKKEVGSGQGELFTAAEMAKVIGEFKYTAKVHTGPSNTRAAFITAALAAKQPVLFAYICGGGKAVTTGNWGNATGTAGTHYGPHWSLIIKEGGDAYTYLNPHNPNLPVTQNRQEVLKSCGTVDSVKYVRYWSKPGPHGLMAFGNTKPTSGKYYDIGDESRQNLNGVLIAVS